MQRDVDRYYVKRNFRSDIFFLKVGAVGTLYNFDISSVSFADEHLIPASNDLGSRNYVNTTDISVGSFITWRLPG